MGRSAEALPWYEKAIKLAPTRRDLRLALIAQLAGEQKFAEAAAQYEALDQADPNNPDTLRDWGALVLRDTTKPAPERKAAAAAIWRKMLVKKPSDPVTTAQVADLLRQAELIDDALALYQKAAELAPANPQYHEYIGEYLHQLKRPDEAQAAWAKIADGPNKNAKNLARLAEVLAGFGYVKEACRPSDRGGQARPRQLRSPPQAGRLSAPARAVRRRRDRAGRGAQARRERRRERRRPRSPGQERPGRRPGGETDRPAQARDSTRQKGPTAEAWRVLARYLEADAKLPRGGPGGRPGHQGRAAFDPGVDAWPPGCASRPATWATRPTPCGAWPRSTAATAPST